MGVKKGYDLAKKASTCISNAKWIDLEGEEVLVDLSLDVHKYVLLKFNSTDIYNLLGQNPSIDDVNSACRVIVSNRIESCINGFVNRLRLAGVTPTYILDGPPHPLKLAEIARRKANIKKKVDEVNTVANDVLYDINEINEIDDISDFIGDNVVLITSVTPMVDPISVYIDKVCNTPQKFLGEWNFDVAKSKLKSMDVKMISAPHDAEGYAAWLTNQLYPNYLTCNTTDPEHVGLFHHNIDEEIWCTCQRPTRPFGVLTEDCDVIPFGGRYLIRRGKSPDDIVIYDIDKLRSQLMLTQYQLVQTCILMGCDFFDGGLGYGPVKALKLVRENREPKIKVGGIEKQFHEVIPMYWEIVDLFMHGKK